MLPANKASLGNHFCAKSLLQPKNTVSIYPFTVSGDKNFKNVLYVQTSFWLHAHPKAGQNTFFTSKHTQKQVKLLFLPTQFKDRRSSEQLPNHSMKVIQMVLLFQVPHCVPRPFRSQAILNYKKLLKNLLGNSIQRGKTICKFSTFFNHATK